MIIVLPFCSSVKDKCIKSQGSQRNVQLTHLFGPNWAAGEIENPLTPEPERQGPRRLASTAGERREAPAMVCVSLKLCFVGC
jgi:hypothetical protein